MKAAPPHVETTVSVLKELFSLWDSRAVFYGEVLFSSVLAKTDRAWRNVFTFFRPLHKCEQAPLSIKYDYGDFIIGQGVMSLRETKAVLTGIAEREQLLLPHFPAVRLLAFLYPGSSRHFWRSDARNYPVHFPFSDYQFAVDQSCKAVPPSSAVWTHHLPLYPSGRVAIEDLLHTRLGDDRAYEGVLTALVPDYRGRISGIRLLNNGISVQIAYPQGGTSSALGAKLYYEDAQGARLMKDLDFEGSDNVFVAANSFPRRLVVVLFSKVSHELIDERIFDAEIPFRPTDLTIEEVAQNVETLIAGGESDSVEFKSQIPQKQEAIAVTAVAFANQKGGRIFIGVENDGQIVGYSSPNVKEAVTNILRDRCEPTLDLEVENVTVRGTAVLMVTVFEGKDKPYQVKEKGFYLRMQGTNRLVSRYELDEIYRLKSGNLRFSVPSMEF